VSISLTDVATTVQHSDDDAHDQASSCSKLTHAPRAIVILDGPGADAGTAISALDETLCGAGIRGGFARAAVAVSPGAAAHRGCWPAVYTAAHPDEIRRSFGPAAVVLVRPDDHIFAMWPDVPSADEVRRVCAAHGFA
jgi:hypothetical protein